MKTKHTKWHRELVRAMTKGSQASKIPAEDRATIESFLMTAANYAQRKQASLAEE